MTVRALVGTGLCAVLVPLVSGVAPLVDPPAGPSLWSVVGATSTLAQPGADLPVRGSRIEPRPVATGLAPTIALLTRAGHEPAWIAWRVDAVAGRGGPSQRWNHGEAGRCLLEDDGGMSGTSGVSGDTRRLVVLARAEAGAITRVTFTDERCTVHAGQRLVYWLADVDGSESVEWLARLIRAHAEGAAARAGKDALPALALHGSAAADRALASLVAAGQPRELRRDAAFWLGAARGASGLALVTRLAREDADDSFREHLTFVLTLPGEDGIDTLFELARRDASSRVRSQALFWLGQKAGARAGAALDTAVSDDPDREVRRKAVFAISQLPRDEGVPRLIALARTHRDAEVRKQAMFWLGQSGDSRAVEFFQDVLAK